MQLPTPIPLSIKSLTSFFQNANQNCIIILNTSGAILAINPAFTENFGYEEADIVGKNFSLLFTEEDQIKKLPESEIERVLSTGQSNDNNYLVNKSKNSTWVSGESLLIKNEKEEIFILKVVQNIHVQKATEISFRVLNNLNENVLSTIRDAVIVLDEKMSIIKSNEAFSKLTGKLSELSSWNFADFLKSYVRDGRLLQALQNAIDRRSGFSNWETEIEIFSGNKKNFEITCTPLLNSHKKNFLLTLHDITIYKEMEKVREDTIGFVSHELRNPLTNLLLSNELMTEAVKENDIEKIKSILNRFERSVLRMNKMISSLSESTKIHSGVFVLEKTEFHFATMIKETIEIMQNLHPSFQIVLEGNGDFMVVADRYRLIQVLSNYLSNAIKYSGKNHTVKVMINQNDTSATVAVHDEGIGISKESLPYVFERFFRVKKTNKIEGIGLGLYLCKQIIHAHGGNVWADSKENKETTFYFTIPLMPQK